MNPEKKAVTYGSYLKIDELLSLQSPLSDGPEHDEMLFIVIHQVYELWFKQVRHELNGLLSALKQNDTPMVLATLSRTLRILKTLVAQVDVLETMTPLSFNAFRTRLEASSGFQSWQFRAIEFLLGHKRQSMIDMHVEGSEARHALQRLFDTPDVFTVFLEYLRENMIYLPAKPSQADIETALLSVYHSKPYHAQVCERLVDLDEGLQEWRYRHVKMVERTIGAKMGTGGSEGFKYLQNTLFTPLFPALWNIRSQL